MAFLDREYELAWLDQGYSSGRPEFRIIYGRRRVGKSALLDEFARGKRHVLYQAVEGSTADQLRDLMDCLKNLYLRFWFRYVLPYRNRLEHSTNVVGF